MIQECCPSLHIIALLITGGEKSLIAKEHQHAVPINGRDREILCARAGGVIQNQQLTQSLDAHGSTCQDKANQAIIGGGRPVALHPRNSLHQSSRNTTGQSLGILE